jgi:CTP:phosphocholine cytidylyltransferase-like protein
MYNIYNYLQVYRFAVYEDVNFPCKQDFQKLTDITLTGNNICIAYSRSNFHYNMHKNKISCIINQIYHGYNKIVVAV